MERAREDARAASARAEKEAGDAASRVAALERVLTEVQAELNSMRASTAWLATWPLRAVGKRVPYRLRRIIRGSAKVLWWAATCKLRSKFRERHHNDNDIVAGTRLSPDLASPARLDRPEDPASAQAPESAQPPARRPIRQSKLRTEPIDIIICVHNALESAQSCIKSVLRCTMPPYRVVIVDDGSDLETASYLDQVAGEQGFSVFRNVEPLGYARAANIGLGAATAPWVVLLNSDTIVSPGWLDRMWSHGDQDPSIGVIGPLSNTASWQSIPRVFDSGDCWAENPLPSGVTVEDMAALVEENALGAVPMPFIDGFCLMIRSSLLKSVGLFDEEASGGGDGEENDFCLRARYAGWSLVVATNAFVYHARSKNYTPDGQIGLAQKAAPPLQKHEPQRDIWPQMRECRCSLAMASVRARSGGALAGREIIRQGQASHEGRRIAFVLPVAPRGGGANVILQESWALQRMGVDVTLIGFDGLWQIAETASEVGSPEIVTLANSEAITRHLIQQQDQYDAVIATLYRSVYWLPLHADFRLGYYIQDFEPYRFPQDDEEYSTALLSYTYSERIRLITKTIWNQKEIARHTGRRAVVVGPSVDTMMFAPGLYRKPDDPIRIAAIVCPSPPKRAPARTVAVLDRVASELGASASVAIFGADDDELRDANLDSTLLKNAGRLNRTRMAALLAETDIFVDCSDYQAMGLTALEAMAAGCAVVAPERGGCKDFIQTGQNGLLVNTEDQTACVDAVLRLARDKSALTAVRLQAITAAGTYIPERAALRLLGAIFDD